MQFRFHFCRGACSVEVAVRQQLGLWGLWAAATIDLNGLIGDVSSLSAQLLPLPSFSQFLFYPFLQIPVKLCFFLVPQTF